MTTLASDTFTRTTSGGWGTATTGGAWTVTNTTYFSTDGSRGNISVNAAGTTMARLASIAATTTETAVSVGFAVLPNGGKMYAFVHGRSLAEAAGSTTSYGIIAAVDPTGAITLYERVNGTGSNLVDPGITITASDRLNVRLRVTGKSPTTIRARVWKAGTTEPTAWQIDTTDTTAALQTNGAVALGSYLGSGNTNGPITISFDDLTVTDAISNAAPTVSAGADQSATVGATVTLAGTAADSDGSIASYQWSCTSYPAGAAAPTITNSNAATARAVVTAAGAYVFRLQVSDNGGATAQDSLTVTVQPAASAPPTMAGSVTAVLAVIDTTDTVDPAGGTLTYSCSPAPVAQPAPGYFVVQQGSAASTYTVTATSSAGGSSTKQYTVPAAAATANSYNGAMVNLDLPVPLDPTTKDVWGDKVDAAFTQLTDAIDDLIDYYNGDDPAGGGTAVVGTAVVG